MTTAYTYDHRFLLHDTGVDAVRLPSGSVLDPEPHPSSLRITRRTAQLIAHSGLLNELVEVPARPASRGEIERFHTAAYVRTIRDLTRAGGGLLPQGTPVVRGTWDAAVLAAGAAATLTHAVLEGSVTRAFALLRPPGHQAAPDRGFGYSLFNNVAIGARAATSAGAARVAIVDWDVHHGSGTQLGFWDDPAVLVVSLHQEAWFPIGAGRADEVGGEGARGRTVNIPLPAGTGDRGVQHAVERLVEPILRAFEPDLVLVSAGQDGSLVDPLGRLQLTTAGYRELGRRLRTLADELCAGRLVVVHEGGYSAGYAPFCTLAVLEGIVGVRTQVHDPMLVGTGARDERRGRSTAIELDRLTPWQEAAVEAVADVQRAFWKLP